MFMARFSFERAGALNSYGILLLILLPAYSREENHFLPVSDKMRKRNESGNIVVFIDIAYGLYTKKNMLQQFFF